MAGDNFRCRRVIAMSFSRRAIFFKTDDQRIYSVISSALILFMSDSGVKPSARFSYV